jgi:septum formation protein
MPPALLLASASPRRRDLLVAAGFDVEVAPADVDERPRAGETAGAHVVRLAHAKASAIAAAHPSAAVLGADTVVVADGSMLGKPLDDADARRMLRLLSGATHVVLTGVALHARGVRLDALESSRVTFLPLDEAEIEWYVATGEPLDKAGAYAIQGRASRFVDRVEGSYSNVVGLPVATVYRLLKQL